MWNVTSMINKTPDIMEHLIDRDPTVVFISETWLKSDTNDVTSLVKDYGYKLHHNRRQNRRKEIGGGVGILLKSCVMFKKINYKQFSSFEHIIIKVPVTDCSNILLVCIYRVLFISIVDFLDEIVTLFEMLVTTKENFILAGDVNIHMDVDDVTYTNKFKDILDMFNMIQHVDFPTHIQGHTLDVIVTFQDGPLIKNIISNEYDVSHHFLVDFDASIDLEKREENEIMYRKIKNIDPEVFKRDITEKILLTEGSFGDNVNHYNRNMRKIIDKHAPLKSRKIKSVPEAPWFDAEYAFLRKQRRKAEKKYRKSLLVVDKDEYIKLRKQTTQLAHKKKCSYYGEKMEGLNNKVLFSSINKLLDNEPDAVLPESTSDSELANNFLEFFSDKIKKIRATFKNDEQFNMDNSGSPIEKLVLFDAATEDEISEIVTSFGVKCSPDDPIPASVLKTYSELLIPIWTKLVNMSLEQGSMDCLKNAVVIPIIKQLDSTMDKDEYKNYRPVSNLLFLGKLIERIVSVRLDKHMTDNNLHSEFQHGYKKCHSTETILLKVVNDLLLSCDKQFPTIVMLLDLSAAFDTVDQVKLLSILRDEIGVDGVALRWFESFLRGRTQKVKVYSSYSNVSDLDYGVAQGSVLGPPLFNIYIRSLKKHVHPSRFSIFGFADDHQLLKTFLPFFQVEALDGDINKCLRLLSDWMNSFFLKLNASKTKILVIMPPSLRTTIRIQGTFIDKKCIRFVHSAKNLGVILDDQLSFKDQINQVVKSCFLTIRRLCRIKAFLTFEQLRIAVSSLIFSKIDYCNSLYYGIKAELVMKLQYVQNSVARLVRRKHFDGSTDEVISYCHWLPVKQRIIFKICLIVRKCLNGTAPNCLKSMLHYMSSTRTFKLDHCKYTGKFGARSFAVVGPKLWNLLPLKIRSEVDLEEFKKALKTFLFEGFHDLEQKIGEK